ncbi:AAA family ATPase [Aliarcobacter cryaerophilus]|uniref:AAA family ATPase n=1 Tax=Aliarcobacter cryaerophilus TaxID=28198 RepID=UPI000830E7CE|nr:AAA family ATPase [Aliarcobacter cryaerophilus]MCT7533789.1 ATP-binding protein [Aliarcobacter cryaerophilus]MCT7542329.1 ATP-binding protein [Aliarcobacter cryaerophilus]
MKLVLKEVKVYKYKCFLNEQKVAIDPKTTTIVGMNESGKTSFLSAIAKTNYFDDSDNDFKFDTTHDYPRNELIDFEEDDEDEGKIVSCTYVIPKELIEQINKELKVDVFNITEFTYSCNYRDSKITLSGIEADDRAFIQHLSKNYELSEPTIKVISELKSIDKVSELKAAEDDIDLSEFKAEIAKYANNPTGWNNLGYHIYITYIRPAMPKFWYFDDYYPLSGKININKMSTSQEMTEQDKTARALFELAKIKPQDVLNAQTNEYERFVALLEASANKITKEVFKFWTTNTNLDIEFKIQEIKNAQNQSEKYLDIRVKSQRHKITLPLDRRSKGFNWFFSFIVWFSKIQSDKKSDYILLLDEPGLNLHASAQADLLRFITELADKYQIIYTTHSPFMVDSAHLNRVRTCLETDAGSVISDSIQEKDPNTLFPLQAALGYDIAQNLFISKKNLLVEGPADLLYLTFFSNLLHSQKRTGLQDDITIVPVGGLDKVTTFISLLRGSKLGVACLLDTFVDQKGNQKVQDLISQKIIKDKHIRFFDEFVENSNNVADIEDLFDKDEYLKYFNLAFAGEYQEIKVSDLDNSMPTILKQINKVIGKDRFNHYRPANKLNQLSPKASDFSKKTLDRYEKIFIEINKLY